MSPAEARFLQLMGGRVITIKQIRHWQTKFPMAIYWSMGKLLKAEHFKREVRYGRYFVDFSNDVGRIIEIDGNTYHMDVVADMDREIYIRDIYNDARFLRIPAYRIYNDSQRVQANVLKFIYN